MIRSRQRLLNLAAVAFLAVMTAACAGNPPPPADPVQARAEAEARARANDPLEGLNRATFAFNRGLDKVVLRPVTVGYRAITPKPVRTGFGHALRNLGEPYTAINDLLQGKPSKAAAAIWRFVVNSTVGIGGLLDVAKKADVPYHYEDFGQTLAVWGVGEGPYVMLPIVGPSNLRDSVGFGVGVLADPVVRLENREGGRPLSLGIFAAGGVDTRDRQFELIDDLFERPDPYVAARSAWRQNREFQVLDGQVTESKEEEDLFDEGE